MDGHECRAWCSADLHVDLAACHRWGWSDAEISTAWRRHGAREVVSIEPAREAVVPADDYGNPQDALLVWWRP